MTQVSFPRPYYPEFEEKFFGLLPGSIPVMDAVDGTETTTTVTWNNGLTAEQLAVVNDIVKSLGTGMSLTLYQAIKGELPTLRNYLTTPNPTSAQTAAATKSIIRTLRALIKD